MKRNRVPFAMCFAFFLAAAAVFPPPAMPLEWGTCPAEWTAAPLPQVNPFWYYDTEIASAYFLAPAANLRSVLPTTELPVLEIAPGVGIVQITFFQYREIAELEPYNELAVGILVADESLARGYSPAYVLHLPVTTEEAMTAGIRGWGFPKTLAKIKCHDDSREGSRGITCTARADGLEIMTLEMNTENLSPGPSLYPGLTFTVKDDLLVKAYFVINGNTLAGTDYGGAKLIFGDHPIGQHLRVLGVSAASVQHLWAPSVQNALYLPHACAPLY